MFDIGFWELSVISIVALIVIGPERLPGVARKAGLWVGQMKRFVGNMKTEIDKELKTDELKKILEKQADSAGIHEILEEGKSALDEVKNDLNETENTLQAELNRPAIDDSAESTGAPESITADKKSDNNG